jgi:hypothetical protein
VCVRTNRRQSRSDITSRASNSTHEVGEVVKRCFSRCLQGQLMDDEAHGLVCRVCQNHAQAACAWQTWAITAAGTTFQSLLGTPHDKVSRPCALCLQNASNCVFRRTRAYPRFSAMQPLKHIVEYCFLLRGAV